jgi:hypothetical protein
VTFRLVPTLAPGKIQVSPHPGEIINWLTSLIDKLISYINILNIWLTTSYKSMADKFFKDVESIAFNK